MYSFKNIIFKFDDYIYKDLRLHIPEKKIGIIGGNGVGKTTLLKLMAGSLSPQAGKALINGDTYFINFELGKYNNFTPSDLVDLCNKLKSFNCVNIEKYITALHLESYMETPIGKLSKGTTKKISLLLGFLSVHKVLLIDEPFESLDKKSNENIINIFKNEERGLVIVSHDTDMLSDSVEAIFEVKNKGLERQ